MEHRGGRSMLERVALVVAGVIGLGQTAISAYWALGGLWAIDTVGGSIEDLALSGDARASWLAWGATVLKACGLVLVLLLTMRRPSRIPRVVLLIAGWGAAAVLTVYGGLLTVVGAAAFTGLIAIPADANRYALGWHLAFWDPLFLIWGLALGIVVRAFQQSGAAPSVSLPGESPPAARPRRN